LAVTPTHLHLRHARGADREGDCPDLAYPVDADTHQGQCFVMSRGRSHSRFAALHGTLLSERVVWE
jgi:hypothetical protein